MAQQNKCPGKIPAGTIKSTSPCLPRYRGIGVNDALRTMIYNSRKTGIKPHMVGLST